MLLAGSLQPKDVEFVFIDIDDEEVGDEAGSLTGGGGLDGRSISRTSLRSRRSKSSLFDEEREVSERRKR